MTMCTRILCTRDVWMHTLFVKPPKGMTACVVEVKAFLLKICPPLLKSHTSISKGCVLRILVIHQSSWHEVTPCLLSILHIQHPSTMWLTRFEYHSSGWARSTEGHVSIVSDVLAFIPADRQFDLSLGLVVYWCPRDSGCVPVWPVTCDLRASSRTQVAYQSPVFWRRNQYEGRHNGTRYYTIGEAYSHNTA